MTKNYILITLLLLTIAFSSCKITQRVAREHQKFFPEDIKFVYLGMNLDQLKSIRDVTNLSIDPSPSVTYAFEKFSNKDFYQITYQFNSSNILYEVIISYNDSINTFDFFEQKHGQSNSKKEWEFINMDGINIKIWVYKNRLCIANSQYFD